jgi:hypothetical protein
LNDGVINPKRVEIGETTDWGHASMVVVKWDVFKITRAIAAPAPIVRTLP